MASARAWIWAGSIFLSSSPTRSRNCVGLSLMPSMNSLSGSHAAGGTANMDAPRHGQKRGEDIALLFQYGTQSVPACGPTRSVGPRGLHGLILHQSAFQILCELASCGAPANNTPRKPSDVRLLGALTEG